MKTKILFDGNCIVCDTEISHYQKIAPDLFEIIDIHSPEFKPESFALTAKAVNQKMHLITSEGEIKTGVDAFTYIWSQIDKYKFAAKIVQLPGIKSLAELGYLAFTYIRPILPKKSVRRG